MLAKHWQHWQSVGKFADVLPTLPTDGQHWPDLACLLGTFPDFIPLIAVATSAAVKTSSSPRCVNL